MLVDLCDDHLVTEHMGRAHMHYSNSKGNVCSEKTNACSLSLSLSVSLSLSLSADVQGFAWFLTPQVPILVNGKPWQDCVLVKKLRYAVPPFPT